MSGFKTGSLSQLFLPRILQTDPASKGDHPSKDGGPSKAGGPKQKEPPKNEGAGKEKVVPEEWWSKNPSPVAGWKIPDGKAYSDFFDFNNEALKANSMGWPKLRSHDPRKKGKRYLCIKYQCRGNCANSCSLAHADPEKIDEATKRLIDERMKVILG